MSFSSISKSLVLNSSLYSINVSMIMSSSLSIWHRCMHITAKDTEMIYMWLTTTPLPFRCVVYAVLNVAFVQEIHGFFLYYGLLQPSCLRNLSPCSWSSPKWSYFSSLQLFPLWSIWGSKLPINITSSVIL